MDFTHMVAVLTLEEAANSLEETYPPDTLLTSGDVVEWLRDSAAALSSK